MAQITQTAHTRSLQTSPTPQLTQTPTITNMAGLVIKPRARIFHGHHWVYASEVKKTFGQPQPGDTISLKDFKDRPLGSAIYNPQSQIIARRYSRRKQALDLDFLQRRLRTALTYRETLAEQGHLDLQLCRLVWSESDGLPGVILDRYGSTYVLQTLTLALAQRLPDLTAAIKEIYQPTTLLLRNDSPMLRGEGLTPETKTLHGPEPTPHSIQHQGITFHLDHLQGQKTGLYLDIIHTYPHLAQLAHGRTILDLFCNQGGFSLFCARAGASQITSVDISEHATTALRHNAELNHLPITTHTANAFDYLRQTTHQQDLIILDPPSFTKNKKNLQDALRGYKEIHLRALRLLNPHGYLATFCCSHHVSAAEFLQTICSAANDAKKTVRLIHRYQQRLDHPIIPTIPESEYLKGYLLQLTPSP